MKIVSLPCKHIQFLMVALSVTVHKALILLVFLNHPYQSLAFGGKLMYKFERYRQLGPANFNQPVGFKMDPENRWVKKSETIPWDTIEEKYAKLFPSKTGMPEKPLRMALGSLLIQKNGSQP